MAKEERKICPLFFMSGKGSLEVKPDVHCLEDGCAWYVNYENPKRSGCAIEQSSDFLQMISYKYFRS